MVVVRKPLSKLSAAVGCAMLLGSSAALAGIVTNTNSTACADGTDSVACIGAWNLDNAKVNVINLTTGNVLGAFNPATGAYPSMTTGDGFFSQVFNKFPTDPTAVVTAKLYGKNWPVGEPTGIKAVNGDTAVQNGKPENCLINTSYLSGAYLDSASPQQVICSSPFQTHKRFKVAMQPSTLDGTGGPVDLVFNTTDNGVITPYQVFSKINNYTDKRLAGYKIEVGVGKGANFKTASELGISNALYLSLGKYEDTGTIPGTDLFTADGLATFSHGLFGAIDLPHFPNEGFFSNTTAYYPVEQGCSSSTNATPGACSATVNPDGVSSMPASDTIYSSGALSSNYTSRLGDWLPSNLAPEGIFYDDDNNPKTDAKLVAYWNGKEWLRGQADGFAPVSAAELEAWANNPLYSEAMIEDVLNLGINYIVHVGDINGAAGTLSFAGSPTFTVRIIPVISTNQAAPVWDDTLSRTPPPLNTYLTSGSTGGGGALGPWALLSLALLAVAKGVRRRTSVR